MDCDTEESRKGHKVPAKVLRHFPLIPRLKRLFMCSKTASSLRWHAEERSRDGKLRHPADGQAWKEFDLKHQDFARDTRNIRLGLSSDGFPFCCLWKDMPTDNKKEIWKFANVCMISFI